MIAGAALAKVNLSLRVGSRGADGLHPIDGLFQSIAWWDRLWLEVADEDHLEGEDGRPIPFGEENLAWRAVIATRSAAGVSTGFHLRLHKRVPTASGLGGGSADAAAALAATATLLDIAPSDVSSIGAQLGSDVPFCLVGGLAEVGGRGERVDLIDRGAADYAMAVVVPPVELATADVYRLWDTMGEPDGPIMAASDVPPSLRHIEPLINDLTPAAVSIAPGIAEWRSDLERSWGRGVLLSGSGPALFAFFVDRDEAEAALASVPPGARAATAVEPVSFGWALADGEGPAVESHGRDLALIDEGRWTGILDD